MCLSLMPKTLSPRAKDLTSLLKILSVEPKVFDVSLKTLSLLIIIFIKRPKRDTFGPKWVFKYLIINYFVI